MNSHTIFRDGPPADRNKMINALRFVQGVGPKNAARIADGDLVSLNLTADAARKLEAVEGISITLNGAAAPEQKDGNEMANPVAPAGNDIGTVLAGAVLPVIQQQIQTLVDNAIGARVPREIVIQQADRPEIKLDGHVHPQFEKVLRLVKAGVGVMLVGPAGCGKTHLFGMVAEALGVEHSSISLSGGVTEAHLTGRLLPTGEGGRFVYTESPFVRRYREGGAFLLDEMDGADPNVLLAINQATANGGFDIESRAASGLDTYVKRHANTVLMATANTYGTGAGALYVGRNQLDAATLDRWYVVQMDYDKAFEERIAPSQVTHFVWRLRELITANKWRRVASTRMIQKAAAALGAGLDWTTVRADLLSGYTGDELNKITF